MMARPGQAVPDADGRALAGLPEEEAIRRLFRAAVPPLDLTSDMLLAAALVPAGPLRRTFPGVPFVALCGYTPLVMWFSRVKQICHADAAGGRRCIGRRDVALYNELTVVALLWRRALFAPGIYATSQLTILAGHGYGMPKQPTLMRLEIGRRWIGATVEDGGRRTRLQARLVTKGRGLGRLLTALWPRRLWPARFPSGTQVRVQIRATPRVQLARIRQGRLALAARWVPQPARLLALGIYLADQVMELPAPGLPDGGHMAEDSR